MRDIQPMKTHYRKTVPALVLVFGLQLAQVSGETDLKNTDATVKTRLAQAIFNFHEVAPGVYRSGRIPEETYPYLSSLGIKTVINFIYQKRESARENLALKELGIETVWIPWNGFDNPKDEHVKQFLDVMRDESKRPVLIHCKRGAERTGVMVACWRIAEEGWTAERAYKEMLANKFRPFRYGHLKKYVFEFAKRYGQTANYTNNIWERLKTGTLYGIYRLWRVFGALPSCVLSKPTGVDEEF
jgi:protein-tyrosine phosphatase